MLNGFNKSIVWNNNVQRYSEKLRGVTLDQMIQYARSEASVIANDLRKLPRIVPKPTADAPLPGKNACFARAFALIKACQGQLIDFFLIECANGASDICKNEEAHCKGLERKIREPAVKRISIQ